MIDGAFRFTTLLLIPRVPMHHLYLDPPAFRFDSKNHLAHGAWRMARSDARARNARNALNALAVFVVPAIRWLCEVCGNQMGWKVRARAF